MALRIPDKIEIENFTIENNILKGIDYELEDNVFVGDTILRTLDSAPDHVAQIDGQTGNKTIFAEMKDRSIRCALWMREYGIKPGDIITVCSHNHLNTYVPIFATFYVGATFNGWDHEISLKNARQLMKLIKPTLIFTCESAVNVLLEAAELEKVNTDIIVFGSNININSLDDILRCESKDKIRNFLPLRMQNPDEIALILLTSGTTGTPKGVKHSYRNFLKLVQTLTVFPLKGVLICMSTVCWLTGIISMFVSIFTEGTKIILEHWDMDEGCKVIYKYKVDHMFMPSHMVNYFCKSRAFEKYNLKSIKHIFTSGVKMNRQVLEEFKCQLPKAFIYQGYGLSEAGRLVTSQTENSINVGSSGFVTSNTHVKIMDVENKSTLGPNGEGEICVKQSTFMLGYYKDLEETEKAIDEDGWFHTGDKGYFDERGELMVTDRLKNMMKCRHFPISPVELEEVLLSHPAVVEVAVVPIPHEIDTERPMAFVKKCADAQVSEDELIALTLTVLGENKKLRGGVQFLKELPKTPSGKLDRLTLKEMAKTLQHVHSIGTNCCNA